MQTFGLRHSEITQAKLFDQYPQIATEFDSAIIANTKENCEIYAPEINWYLSHANADEGTKLANVYRLFQTRLSIYDNAPYKEYSLEVPNTLAIIGNESELTQDFITQAQEFDCILIPPTNISHISGELGAFKAVLNDGNEIEFAQAVLFVNDENLPKFLGIVSVQDFGSAKDILALLSKRLGTYTYKTTTLYNPHICQYHQRRPDSNGNGYCHKCVNVCPTFGVSKNDSLMELSFSQLNCMGCGGCIATCPTGALDFASFSIECMIDSLKYYQNTVILLIPEVFLDTLRDISLPSHLSPLIIPREKFPSEVHFLSMVQESNHSMIFYSPIISRPSLEAIKLVNDIYQAICQKQAIFIAQDRETLQTLYNLPTPLPHYSYIPSPKEARRKHFGERLRYLIKDGDFGTIESGESGEMIRYGRIHIDESKCTLCNSCVGACNVDCLSANAQEFALQYNPSLCTTCGYCIPSCPENALRLELSGIELNPSWFETHILAKDELFTCVECGKPFATKKSIQKIKGVMSSHFLGDNAKLRTLECCSDCKVKIMFENV
ncbi:4Fe-4S dicluster domain-containing protein [Helicobacter cholecystus]|uniref:4Fe-4S dicluster domain-containing protein n=1 Tax=Helicobacter cholecystus TaxID=45498 RepID=A0A3D8IS90_9HELI|nr:4Fe-4S dicluster domain-containing protein [Helicobacter cholecystus]RDU68139.1 4Fe-4S dicluster domain-containing protein [Helicobacter cholecystus]VEJ24528.1 iron-sulfur cluster-binding domain-containing protein [Helicobacter cholecystus]